MLILEISYLHALCYNIYVIFIVVIIRPLGPRFIVSHRASGFAGTALVQHQLEHQLPPSEAPADPSICPSLSSRRRHHQVVGLLELCDGHGAGFAFEFVYREQLSQPQVARSCMPMRCCSFSLWNLISKTLGKDQPVRGAQRDERQSL